MTLCYKCDRFWPLELRKFFEVLEVFKVFENLQSPTKSFELLQKLQYSMEQLNVSLFYLGSAALSRETYQIYVTVMYTLSKIKQNSLVIRYLKKCKQESYAYSLYV